MAKTKPIGVRFSQDMLDIFKEEGIADSPQKALNFLTDFYNTERNKDLVEKFKNSKLFKPRDTNVQNLTILPPQTNFSINTIDLETVNSRIKQIEHELANPPKYMSITMKLYRSVREKEIQSLQQQLKL
jgi:hypothetical protein